MSDSADCADLIGKPYRLGGGDDSIDCIQLVYEVLKRHEIPTPKFEQSWYSDSRFKISRALLAWGDRITQPSYTGDVGLTEELRPTFVIVWLNGVLYINQQTNAVAWCPIGRIQARWFRCSHLNAI